jgi:energy-coupling factor transporter transmembrane protein EcfT
MNYLKFWAWAVLIAMLVVTSWASLHESIFHVITYFPDEPWWVATLFDTYFAFIFFWLWIVYREGWSIPSFIWLIAILLLGNIAMSIYVLLAIQKAQDLSDLFRRQSA